MNKEFFCVPTYLVESICAHIAWIGLCMLEGGLIQGWRCAYWERMWKALNSARVMEDNPEKEFQCLA